MKKLSIIVALILVFSMSINVFAVSEEDRVYDENRTWAIGEYKGSFMDGGDFSMEVFEEDGYLKANISIIGFYSEPIEFTADAYAEYDADDYPDDRKIKTYYDHNGPEEIEIEVEFDDGVWEAEIEEEHGEEKEIEFIVEKVGEENSGASSPVENSEDNTTEETSEKTNEKKETTETATDDVAKEGTEDTVEDEVSEEGTNVENNTQKSSSPIMPIIIAVIVVVVLIAIFKK